MKSLLSLMFLTASLAACSKAEAPVPATDVKVEAPAAPAAPAVDVQAGGVSATVGADGAVSVATPEVKVEVPAAK
jgi:hypothetical protein